jgi:hypothetical protein
MLRMRGTTPPSLHKHLYNLTLKTMQLTLMYLYVKLQHAWRPPANKRCKTGDTNCSTTDCKFQASSVQHVIISSAFFLILHAAPTLLNPSLQDYLLAFFLSGPGSSVGIATGYLLDGPGIYSRWGRDFLHLSKPALGTMGTVSFPGVKSQMTQTKRDTLVFQVGGLAWG